MKEDPGTNSSILKAHLMEKKNETEGYTVIFLLFQYVGRFQKLLHDSVFHIFEDILPLLSRTFIHV